MSGSNGDVSGIAEWMVSKNITTDVAGGEVLKDGCVPPNTTLEPYTSVNGDLYMFRPDGREAWYVGISVGSLMPMRRSTGLPPICWGKRMLAK